MTHPRVLVLGLGNRLMADDRAGLDALALLFRTYRLPAGVDRMDGGTLGLDLLAHIHGYPAVLVLDCIVAGRSPGTVLRLDGADVPAALGRHVSPHQAGLADLVAALELLGRVPERFAVVGVEPLTLDPGLELSEPVRAALPVMVWEAARVLREWGVGVTPVEAHAALAARTLR